MLSFILRIHIVVAVVYLIFILIKIISMMKSAENFEKLKTKTRFLQILLDSLLVLSGVVLVLYSPSIKETWFWVKFILFLGAIPLAIVGFKRNIKILAIISWLILIYLYGLSETKSISFDSDKKRLIDLITWEEKPWNHYTHLLAGQKVYETTCIRCHGSDGKMGYFKAKNLTESELTDEEMFTIISKGRGVMPGYSFLDSVKRKDIVEYIRGFRK